MMEGWKKRGAGDFVCFFLGMGEGCRGCDAGISVFFTTEIVVRLTTKRIS